MTKKITLSHLDLHHRFVALEAVDVFHAGSVGIKKFVEMVVDTSSFIKQSFNNIQVYFKDNKKREFDQYRAFANRHKYFDVKDINIFVPEGFVGPYDKYSELLFKVVNEFSAKFISELITPYDLYISKLINNPSLLESANYNHSIKPKDVEKYKKDIAKFFKPKALHIETKLSTVFGNMNALTKTADLADRIIIAQNLLDTTKVKAAVDKLNDKLIMLAEMISNDTNNINVNAKMLSQLSQLTFDIAKYTEFFATVDTLVSSYLAAVRSTNKVLIDVK